MSNFHRLAVAVLIIRFQKQDSKTLKYRNYEKHNNEEFGCTLLEKLIYADFQSKQLQVIICNLFCILLAIKYWLSQTISELISPAYD